MWMPHAASTSMADHNTDVHFIVRRLCMRTQRVRRAKSRRERARRKLEHDRDHKQRDRDRKKKVFSGETAAPSATRPGPPHTRRGAQAPPSSSETRPTIPRTARHRTPVNSPCTIWSTQTSNPAQRVRRSRDGRSHSSHRCRWCAETESVRVGRDGPLIK